jgi:hypothetical protein
VRNPIGLYATTNGTPSGVIGTAVGSVSYGFDAAANAYTAIAARTLTKMALVDTASPTVSLTLSASNNLNSMVLLPGQAYTLYVYGQVDNPAEPLGATWVTDFPAL